MLSFAAIAWPAHYGETRDTAAGASITAFNPDKDWVKANMMPP